ncbi:MAG: CPBP family intramembrane metalloprotease [Saprospiraceae bacterium]|nr:CPBP family intramembrane metalloprotease [Saprospiraceae bacterium]
MEFNWFDHLVAIILLIVLPFMSIRSEAVNVDTLDHLPPKKHFFYTNGLMLIICALLVLTSWNISDRSWIKLGIQWPYLDGNLLLLIFLVAAIYLSDLIHYQFNKSYKANKIKELSNIIPMTWAEYQHYIFLAVAAGISEEIIFRGFLINYMLTLLTEASYASILSVLIPAIVFSLSHLYQGWWAVLKIMLIAALFGWIFLQTGSLLIIVIVHILIDLISGLTGVLSDGEDPNCVE